MLRLRDYFVTLRASERGNVTIMFGLILMVLLAVSGSAIDYLRLVNERAELAAATDATVLAAVSAAFQADKAGRSAAQEMGQKSALAMWNANVGPWLEDKLNAPTVKITKSGAVWKAVVDFNGQYPTRFMNIFGVANMPLRSHAEASSEVTKTRNFWQFTIAVDTSNSMGIGATAADMTAISKLPGQAFSNCTFACHFTGTDKYFKDSFSQAHAAGIKLRLDVVNDAISAMVTEMEAIDTGSTHTWARLVGLDRDASEKVAMTSDLSQIVGYNLALTNAVVIPNAGQATGDTDYAVSLATVTKSVGVAGDGSSASKPQKAVFIVTDGVHDSYYDEANAVYKWTSQHHLGPIDPAMCKTMKDNGVLVGVLYINYIPPTGLEYLITPYQDKILPNLRACATDGMFHNATAASDIKDAMSQMLQEALTTTVPRLTQ